MSKIYENHYGIYISHKNYIDKLYESINKKLNPQLFRIRYPYKASKIIKRMKNKQDNNGTPYKIMKKESEEVKYKFSKFVNTLLENDFLFDPEKSELYTESNISALETADSVYTESGKNSITNAFGSNIGPTKVEKINDSYFLFPENSIFYAKNVEEISDHLRDKKYDLILLDPPWWNKYIRRKRKNSNDGYTMMFNEELKHLPVENLLNADGIVAVWCTNSTQNLNDLLHNIFPKWQVEFVGKWYWMKMTLKGEPICNFGEPSCKQPYEKIIFGSRKRSLPTPQSGKLLVSIPSALHSHKPPLVELLEPFLPPEPSCLEIFARYLLPGWTSYGNEVLRLQHESLYVMR